MNRFVFAMGLLALSSSTPAKADRPKQSKKQSKKQDNPWARATKPSDGKPFSLGTYNAGCVRGAVPLADSGRGYQLARPSRKRSDKRNYKRNYGHPILIQFIRDLAVATRGVGILLIGDLGQPRGGPAPSGHSSHQSGLDVDIWFWHPKSAERRPLSAAQRAALSPRPVISTTTGKPTSAWTRKVRVVLHQATLDKRVARIFVNPRIKQKLCLSESPQNRAWLAKLRPWWGHNAHFHVRLSCPTDSPACINQAPLPDGDGCNEIDWWLNKKSQAARRKGRKSYQKSVRSMPELPAGCAEIARSSTR